MIKKECKICKKRFTRQWNLERHIRDIHHISEYGENDRVKQKYEDLSYSYPSTFTNEWYGKSENNTTEMDYYENPPEYPNFTNHYTRYDLYNNRSYGNFVPVPREKDENTLTNTDKRRIQYALGILSNFLQGIFPNHVVIPQICWLHYYCYSKRSIQPLRDFYKKNNFMHLWPFR